MRPAVPRPRRGEVPALSGAPCYRKMRRGALGKDRRRSAARKAGIMTAIAAIRYANGIVMGGDSAGVDDSFHLEMRKDPKVFRVGELLIGYTSSFRMAQLMRYGLADCLPIADLRPPVDPADAFEFMVRDFVPRARWLLKQGGYAKVKDEVESGGEFLVAWRRQLFMVQSDFQVAESLDDYSACGCADDVILGALGSFFVSGFFRPGESGGAGKPTVPHADYLSQQAAEEAVSRALGSAEHHSAAVRGPYVILSTITDAPQTEMM